jgi:hypothetical protein
MSSKRIHGPAIAASALASCAALPMAGTPKSGLNKVMRSFHLILSAGLLASMSAYARAAIPQWSAFIATGQGACLESGSCSKLKGLDASSDAAKQATFTWNAFIASGRGACLESGSCSNPYRRLDASNAVLSRNRIDPVHAAAQ